MVKMSLVAIINSDKDLERRMLRLFTTEGGKPFSLHFASTTDTIMEVLNYDLPEIAIINLTDPEINYIKVLEQVKQDLWLHNFGIIGLYDSKVMNDTEASSQLKDYNILGLLDYSRIEHHLLKFVQIIDANLQIIFQYDLADKLSGIISGSFTIDNDLTSVPVYSALALSPLFQHGFIDSEKKMNLLLVMQELLINAIEHGNCKISFDEKTKWLHSGENIGDLVAEKCRDSSIAVKKVYLEWEIMQESSRFIIRDDGDGFDVQKYKQTHDTDPSLLHGRGILIARSLVGRLTYSKKGSIVSFAVDHDTDVMREGPLGFMSGDVIFPVPGDVIFREGEDSDFLYYISSGSFSASLNGRIVGSIDSGDIFMGEMAFLLNNKRSVTVTAKTKGKLIKVSRKSFITIIQKFPHYGIFLAKLIARKLDRSNREKSAGYVLN
jgi:hypothetical protein